MVEKEESMSFENQVLRVALDLKLLGGNPAFRFFAIRDQNVLSRSTKESRQLEAPNKPMRTVHGRLLSYLRELPIEYLSSTACKPGDSPRKNVERHKESRFFNIIDLRMAYRYVDAAKLAECMTWADPALEERQAEMRVFLRQYCMSRFGGIPAGAPASQDLFNLYCKFLLDDPLEKLCKAYELTYSRYVDDLTFSSTSSITKGIRIQIREIIVQAGFQVHDRKAHVWDLQKGPIVINGIGLELGGRIFVPRHYTNYVHGLLLQGLGGNLWLRSKIAGAMGVFRGLTDRQNPNKTEQQILRMHQQFLRLANGQRQKRKKAPAR